MKPTWKAALFAMAALALLAAPAGAQGPDAAKLDELTRIIEQQQKMIEAQARTLEALKTQVEALRTVTQANKAAVTATTEKVAKTTAQVRQVVRQVEQADTPPKMVTSGSDKVKLAISGQVNRALLLAGDGKQTDLFHVDNDNSSTRVRFVGTGKPSEDITVGAQIEVQFESNSSSSVDQNNENAASGVTTDGFTERKLEVFFDHKKLGRLWLGQGDTASNGTSEVDLSGTALVTYSAIQDIGGSLLFRNSTTGALTAVEISDVYSNLDGQSRDDRIRYDTPKFLGFQLSAGLIQGGENDYALRYSGQWGDYKAAGAASIQNVASTSTSIDFRANGSGSLLHEPTGLSLTLAGGQDKMQAAGRANPTFFYSKVGLQRSWFEIGNTALSVDFGHMVDQGQNDDELLTIGVGAVQKLDSWGTEVYAAFRHHQADRAGLNLDHINLGMVGARVKF